MKLSVQKYVQMNIGNGYLDWVWNMSRWTHAHEHTLCNVLYIVYSPNSRVRHLEPQVNAAKSKWHLYSICYLSIPYFSMISEFAELGMYTFCSSSYTQYRWCGSQVDILLENSLCLWMWVCLRVIPSSILISIHSDM